MVDGVVCFDVGRDDSVRCRTPRSIVSDSIDAQPSNKQQLKL